MTQAKGGVSSAPQDPSEAVLAGVVQPRIDVTRDAMGAATAFTEGGLISLSGDNVSALPTVGYFYSATATGNDTVALRVAILAAGVGARIMFDPAVRYPVRGQLTPLEGQEWIDLHLLRVAQTVTTTTALVLTEATSLPVSSVAGFEVGDSINIANTNTPYASTYAAVSRNIVGIDPDTKVLLLDGPLALRNSLTGAVVASLASGAYVGHACFLIGNRSVAGATAPKGIKLTRVDIDDNRAAGGYSGALLHWATCGAVDIVSDGQEIYKLKIRNGVGEGVIQSGEDVELVMPDIDGMNGNGAHWSAYTAGKGVKRGLITGGRIANCNDAPVWAGKVTGDRFASSKNIGHRAGAICVSDEVYDCEVNGTETENCISGVGSIDSSTNARITIRGMHILKCGTDNDGGGEPLGAFVIGPSAGGAPSDIKLSGNVVEDCYRTGIGYGSVASGRATVQMQGNTFIQSPVRFGAVQLAHSSGEYRMAISTATAEYGAVIPMPVLIFEGARGVFRGANITGGYIGMQLQPTGSASIEMLVDGFALRNQYAVGITCRGSGAAPRLTVGAGSIVTDAGVWPAAGNAATSYVGIDMAGAGGFATKINVQGPITIDVASQCYGGVRLEPVAAQSFKTRIANLVILLRAAANSTSYSNGMPLRVGANATDLNFDRTESYPNVDTTGWPGTVTSTNWSPRLP